MSIIDRRQFSPEPEDEDNAQYDSDTQESFRPMNASVLEKIDH